MTMTMIQDTAGQLYEVTLRKAVKEYMDGYCVTERDFKARTIKNHRMALNILIEVCGPDTQLHTLSSTHFQMAMAKARKGDTPVEAIARMGGFGNRSKTRTGRNGLSSNIDLYVYRSFVSWAQRARYYSPYLRPVDGFRPVKAKLTPWGEEWTVPVKDWDTLLAYAGQRHERARFAVAMGLWGGRRESELKAMRVGDIDLDGTPETFRFNNTKSSRDGIKLPIMWSAFMSEIRRYLSWYASQCGELDPEWFLFPRRLSSREYSEGGLPPQMHPGWPVDPTVAAQDISRDVKLALSICNPPTMTGMGSHRLRHTCAVFLLDHEGWALDDVSVWLDHASPQVTKTIYLRGANQVRRLYDTYTNPDREPSAETIQMHTRVAFLRQIVGRDEAA